MISEQRSNALLGYEFGARTFTPVSAYYFGVSTTEIVDGLGHTELPASIGYARVRVDNNTTNWSEPDNFSVHNAVPIEFPTLTANYEHPVIYWFISEYSDASQAGDCAIYYEKFADPRPIISGTDIWFDIGGLTLSRTNPSICSTQ